MKEGRDTNSESSLIPEFKTELEAYKKEFLLAHKRYNELSSKISLFDPEVLKVVKEIIDLKKSLRDGKNVDLIVDALAMLAKQGKTPVQYKEYVDELISARKELIGSSENLIKAKVNTFFTEMGIEKFDDEDREGRLIRILSSKEPNLSNDLYMLLDSTSSILQDVYAAFLKKEIVLGRGRKLVPTSIAGDKILKKAKEEILDAANKEYFASNSENSVPKTYFRIFKAKNDLVEIIRINSNEEVLKRIKDSILHDDIMISKNGQLVAVTAVGENFISSLRKDLLSKIVTGYKNFHYANNKLALEEREVFNKLKVENEKNKKNVETHKNFSEKIVNEKRVDDISRAEYFEKLSSIESKSKEFNLLMDGYAKNLESLSSIDSLFQPDLARFLSLYNSINPKIEELASSMSEISYLASLVKEADDFEKRFCAKLGIKEVAHDKEKITISRNQIDVEISNENHIRLVLENKLRRIFDVKAREKHLSENIVRKILTHVFGSKEFDRYIDLFVEQERIKQILIKEILSSQDIYSRTFKIRNGLNSLFIIEISKEKALSQLISNMTYLVGELQLQKIRMDNLKQVRHSAAINDKMQALQSAHKIIENYRKRTLDLVNDLNRQLNKNIRKIENLHEEINEKSEKKANIVVNSNRIYEEFIKTRETNKKLLEKYEIELKNIDKEIASLKEQLG